MFKISIEINGKKVKFDNSVTAPFWKMGTNFVYAFDTLYDIKIINKNMALPERDKTIPGTKSQDIITNKKLKTPPYDSDLKYLILMIHISRDGKVDMCEFIRGI